MNALRLVVVSVMMAGFCGTAGAVVIPGGGPKKTDCLVVLMANGVGFPAGGPVRGATCADGDVCDADGQRNGVCLFTPTVCVNSADAGISSCAAAQVSSIAFKGKVGKAKLDTSALAAAAAAILPASGAVCSAPVDLAVPVGGPDKNGEFVRGTVKLQGKGKTTKGVDKDKYAFSCLPSVGPQPTTTSTSSPGPTTSTSSTFTPTTEVGATTSTTTSTLPSGVPGAGLNVGITGVAISPDRHVTVTFYLRDNLGIPITPSTAAAAATDPNQARVRLTLARIDVDANTIEGFTTTFTKYVNYFLSASTGVPSYETTGTFGPYNAATGTWTYTFGKTLPAGYPTDLTHTVGGQVQRTYAGQALVANPVQNFVPNGSDPTTVREDITTKECNACHDPLQAHGGGRREVKLCILCHTDQAPDPTTGNPIEFKQMIHRLHMGKELPSVTDGAVGAHYSIGNTAFGEKVSACVNGPYPTAPCTVNADCGAGGTCTGTTTLGVGFPQDIRNCTKCHSAGKTAANFEQLPAVAACTGCHDDVNPGETTYNGIPPGTGHLPGPQPDALCRVCHTADQHPCTTDADCSFGGGSCGNGLCEFDLSVPGAHVVPARSGKLTGLQAEILAASGTPGNPVQVQFRLSNGAGTPLTTFTGMNRIAFAISGSTVDYGGSATTPVITQTAFSSSPGATGTLTGPDGTGLATYTTATNLPADATGTWTVGLEARRPVTINGQSVNEAPQNVVKSFSVDGSTVKARRTVVDIDNCSGCHGTFSVDFSIHGNLRNQTDYCVVCHNAKGSDFARRSPQVVNGADPMDQTIAFKHLIHKIHRGEALEQQPYIVYGFSGGANFGDILFPGDLRDCDKCHTGGSQLLPLDPGVLPTNVSMVSSGTEQVVGTTPPIQDACLACHDAADVAAHAETNTTASGAEACGVCHGEGAIAAVSEVHAR